MTKKCESLWNNRASDARGLPPTFLLIVELKIKFGKGVGKENHVSPFVGHRDLEKSTNDLEIPGRDHGF